MCQNSVYGICFEPFSPIFQNYPAAKWSADDDCVMRTYSSYYTHYYLFSPLYKQYHFALAAEPVQPDVII